jgi:hypothetical protein
LVFAGTAQAAVPLLGFPVVGNSTFQNDYGAPRWNGWHQGIDIMTRRWQPVMAVERGHIDIHYRSLSSTCMLYLHGASGYTYVYIHLNNDLTMNNDNRGGCREGVAYAPGLRDGALVRLGRYLGNAGDSGDADGGQPHLHFEIRKNGVPLNPYDHLRRARRAFYPSPGGTAEINLKLIGRVIGHTSTTFAVRVGFVRMSTGLGYYITRSINLTVPAETVVKRQTASGTAPARLSDAVVGERVIVWTTGFVPSWRTQLAAPGVLASREILLRGG